MSYEEGSRHGWLRAVEVPDVEPLDKDEAVDRSRAAWREARKKQIELVADGCLIGMLFDGRTVTYRRLRGMQYEAHKQLARAQAVDSALRDAVLALEATRIGEQP